MLTKSATLSLSHYFLEGGATLTSIKQHIHQIVVPCKLLVISNVCKFNFLHCCFNWVNLCAKLL